MPQATPNYNLYVLKPNLVREWHPTKNAQVRPADVTPGSGKKVWWICKNGHEWQAVIYSRSRGSGCPYCNKPSASITDNSSLAVLNSNLIKEWHPSANGDVTPRNVTVACPGKVWWICSEGHEWQATLKSRLKGNGCPVCHKGLVKKKLHDFRIHSGARKTAESHRRVSRMADIIFELDSDDNAIDKNFRKSKRIRSQGTAILEIPLSGHWLYAQIRNFSHAGMYVETEVPIKPGTKIVIKFDRPFFSTQQKSYPSIIQWCKRLDDDAQSFSQYGLGVKFI
jgi:hypothetical protein